MNTVFDEKKFSKVYSYDHGVVLHFDNSDFNKSLFHHKHPTKRFLYYKNLIEFLAENPEMLVYFTLDPEVKNYIVYGDKYVVNMSAYISFCSEIKRRTSGRARAFFGRHLSIKDIFSSTDREKFIASNASEELILTAIRAQSKDAQSRIASAIASQNVTGQIPKISVIANEDDVIKTNAGRAHIINKLLEAHHSEEIWRAMTDQNPPLAAKLSLAYVYAGRESVVREFAENIGEKMPEEYWQKLLEKNRWIFGNNYVGIGGERRINIKSTVDHPLITEDGFLEIVETKRPDFPFWKLKVDGSPFLYRDKYLVPYEELQNAIVQGENYIMEAELEVDREEYLKNHSGIVPLKPRCLIVHGRSQGWGKNERVAFRIMNDSLHGVSVITFDHLLARAEQVLELFKSEGQ